MSPPNEPRSQSVPEKLESPLLSQAGFAHGFFTRRGGVSEGIFDSLNFVVGTGDSLENVEQNLAIVARSLDVHPTQIYFLSQVHGIEHIIAHGTEDRREFVQREGDIVLTQKSSVAAAIRTADCVSILLGCRETGWVAACHSGWQGCERGAVIAAVDQMREQGATDIVTAIGPHISLESFEVDEDVALRLQKASPDKEIIVRDGDRPHVNLRKMVRAQLNSVGIRDHAIDDVMGCTVLEPERFFSFRRDKNPSGRLLSAIVGKN